MFRKGAQARLRNLITLGERIHNGKCYKEEEANMDLVLSGAKREKNFIEELFYESHFFTSQARH